MNARVVENSVSRDCDSLPFVLSLALTLFTFVNIFVKLFKRLIITVGHSVECIT